MELSLKYSFDNLYFLTRNKMNKNISQNYVEVAGKILAVSFGIKMVNITLTIIILVVKKNVQ